MVTRTIVHEMDFAKYIDALKIKKPQESTHRYGGDLSKINEWIDGKISLARNRLRTVCNASDLNLETETLTAKRGLEFATVISFRDYTYALAFQWRKDCEGQKYFEAYIRATEGL